MSSLLTHPPATQAPETQPAQTSVDLDALWRGRVDRRSVNLGPMKLAANAEPT